MCKTELVRAMRQFVGGGAFIRRYQLAAFLGRKDAHSVDKYLRGVDRIDGDLYYLQDVADRIVGDKR